MNIGDQFGLSLYRDGSIEATVGEIVGQEFSDAEHVESWIGLLTSVETVEGLEVVAQEIKAADISEADKKTLRGCYAQARTRLEASRAEDSVG